MSFQAVEFGCTEALGNSTSVRASQHDSSAGLGNLSYFSVCVCEHLTELALLCLVLVCDFKNVFDLVLVKKKKKKRQVSGEWQQIKCVSGQKGGQQRKKSARAQEDLIRQVTQLVKGQWECCVKRKAAMCMY